MDCNNCIHCDTCKFYNNSVDEGIKVSTQNCNYYVDKTRFLEFFEKISCKDCVHFDSCKAVHVTSNERAYMARTCKAFSPKPTMPKFPCHIGDNMFYLVKYKGSTYIDTGKVESFSFDDDLGMRVWVHYIVCQTLWHKVEDIGKIAFLTREEAEAKLKEDAENEGESV